MSGRHGRWMHVEDMAWPAPDDLGELEWRLRYGKPSRVDLLTAAGVISAYAQAFLHNPQRETRRVHGLLRKAMAAHPRPSQEEP